MCTDVNLYVSNKSKWFLTQKKKYMITFICGHWGFKNNPLDIKWIAHLQHHYIITAGNRAILPPQVLLWNGIAEHPVEELRAEFKQI